MTLEQQCYHRNTCRLCESPNVELALKLAVSPPVDAYITADRLKEKQEAFPMNLYLCHACGHAQLLDVVSPKLLFGSYIYTTASSPGLVDYFRDYANNVCEKLKLAPGSKVMDIGSNDGTLLSAFKKNGMKVLGVDPAQDIAKAATASGIKTLPQFFNSQTAAQIRKERGPMTVITANNVYAHSDFIADMTDGIASLLAPDGVFVCEVSYLKDMITNMVFDFIYHEHLDHHSVKPLQKFLRAHGLYLFTIDHTPSKGGTLRCFSQLIGGQRPESPSVQQLSKEEDKFGLHELKTFRAWETRIEKAKHDLLKLVRKLKSEGKTIGGYGASATGTVLTYHFDLGDIMKFIIDDNPIRQNRFSPGHHIPILSSQVLADQKPDYVIILAWRFADMIIQRNQKYLDQGGHFIVPMPEMKIL